MAKRLYELQDLDLEIDRCKSSLADIDAQLKDESALIIARAAAEEVKSRLDDLRGRQRDEDLQVQQLRDKITALERKLYSGTVQNPRELTGLQEELRHLKSLYSQLEEKLLGLMLELDEVQAESRDAQTALEQAEQLRRERQSALSQELQRLTTSLAGVQAKRDEVAKGIAQQHMALYAKLRASHSGVAIAKLERDTCRGCRIALPTREVQRARTAQDLVFCTSCGRILYVG